MVHWKRIKLIVFNVFIWRYHMFQNNDFFSYANASYGIFFNMHTKTLSFHFDSIV